MSGNVSGGSGQANLYENEHIKELFAVLNDNGKDTSALGALLGYVHDMEQFVKQAESGIVDMKCQLGEMREIQKHPIKHALQNTISSLGSTLKTVKSQLSKLRANIIAECKKAVSAFKQTGVSALDKLASFFHIKDGLLAVKNSIDKEINMCNKTLAQIDSFAFEYHTAGLGLKNMARVAVGLEPKDKQKEIGKLAKAVGAPARAEKSCLVKCRKSIDMAISKIEKLERDADSVRGEKSEPSLMRDLAAGKEKVRQRDLDMAGAGRATIAKGAEI